MSAHTPGPCPDQMAHAAHALNVWAWRSRVNEAIDALLKRTSHSANCAAYKVIGRFGGRTGLLWCAGDEKKCDCGIATTVAQHRLDPGPNPLAAEVERLHGLWSETTIKLGQRALLLDDLIEACEDVVSLVGSSEAIEPINALRVAIAKARGK